MKISLLQSLKQAYDDACVKSSEAQERMYFVMSWEWIATNGNPSSFGEQAGNDAVAAVKACGQARRAYEQAKTKEEKSSVSFVIQSSPCFGN